MALYRDHVLPRLMDVSCGSAELARWRSKVTAGLRGEIVEVGFGSGRNLPSLPDDVQVVYAVEPSATARRLAESRIAASTVRVVHVGLEGESIPLADSTCDAALCTFTLCTIPDVARALRELRRIVKPGGRLHFLEHGLAPDERVAAWQRRLDPVQQRLAGGCHLTRDPVQLVSEAGWIVERSESRYARGPKPWTWFTEGVAVNPR